MRFLHSQPFISTSSLLWNQQPKQTLSRDPSPRQCNPTLSTSDTRVTGAISLGTCGPSILLFALLKQHQKAGDSTIMMKCKWLFVKGYKCNNLIPAVMQLLTSSQEGRNASMCSGITVQNNDT